MCHSLLCQTESPQFQQLVYEILNIIVFIYIFIEISSFLFYIENKRELESRFISGYDCVTVGTSVSCIL